MNHAGAATDPKAQIKGLAQRLSSDLANSDQIQVLLTRPAPVRENELLFFFKPEVFFPGVDSEKLIAASLSLLASFGIEFSACAAIPGSELEKLSIMDAHYGYINTLSRRASSELSASQLEAIRAAVGASSEIPVLGGHELLSRAPGETPESLDRLWATKPAVKLRSGLYVQQYTFEGNEVVLVNGFHPAQLAHFTAPGRRIALLVLHTDLPWRFVRARVLGDTFPEKALPNSLRRDCLDRAGEYGLQNVSIANNCMHLSAGPFEAGFELQNFFGRAGIANFNLLDTNIGRKLKTDERLKFALGNPIATLNGKDVSLFDATEEMDTTGSVEVLGRVYVERTSGDRR